jgi:hypothetical protein
MAKELPYFKFEPNQWENGNIQMCTREGKGLFIDLCSMYWSRLGDLPLKLAVQKLCAGNATALDSLISDNIFTVIDSMICIDFLNEQLGEFENTSNQNSKNAREGWEKRRKKDITSDRNASASNPQSESDAIREEKIIGDKRKEEERREENQLLIYPTFEDFWNLYDKKSGNRIKSEKLWAFLKQDVKETIIAHSLEYVFSTPEKQYRKNPEVYLKQKHWNNEILIPQKNGKQKGYNPKGVDRNALKEFAEREF